MSCCQCRTCTRTDVPIRFMSVDSCRQTGSEWRCSWSSGTAPTYTWPLLALARPLIVGACTPSISLGSSQGTYHAPCMLADVLAAYPLPVTRTASIRRFKVTVMQQGLLDQLRVGAGYRLLVAPAQMNSCLHDSGSNRRSLAYRTVASFLFLQHPQSCYT